MPLATGLTVRAIGYGLIVGAIGYGANCWCHWLFPPRYPNPPPPEYCRCQIFPVTLAAIIAAVAGKIAADNPDAMPLGLFLGLVRATENFSGVIASLFDSFFVVLGGFSDVEELSSVLNVQTRRHELHDAQHRRELLVEKYESSHGVIADSTMQLHEVEYSHRQRHGSTTTHTNAPLSLDVGAGCIIAVTAQSQYHKGKTILMRLLARQIIPTDGFIVYPSR